MTRLYTRVEEERNYQSWLSQENKPNTYTSIIHLSSCSFGIRSVTFVIVIVFVWKTLRAIVESVEDHFWSLLSFALSGAIFRLSSFLRMEGDTRSSASDTRMSKTNDCTFLENLISREASCPASTISYNASSYSEYSRRSHSRRLAVHSVSQLTKIIYAPGR